MHTNSKMVEEVRPVQNPAINRHEPEKNLKEKLKTTLCRGETDNYIWSLEVSLQLEAIVLE